MVPPLEIPETEGSADNTFPGREARGFLAGVLETTHWQWMNRPTALFRAENKLYQLARAQEIGLTISRNIGHKRARRSARVR